MACIKTNLFHLRSLLEREKNSLQLHTIVHSNPCQLSSADLIRSRTMPFIHLPTAAKHHDPLKSIGDSEIPSTQHQIFSLSTSSSRFYALNRVHHAQWQDIFNSPLAWLLRLNQRGNKQGKSDLSMVDDTYESVSLWGR